MNWQELSPLLVLATAMSFTPGPNTTLSTALAANRGLRHALPRVTLQGHAKVLARGTMEWEACSAAYLARFPDALSMTELGDFRFVAIAITDGRHVSGFGAARSIGSDAFKLALSQDI